MSSFGIFYTTIHIVISLTCIITYIYYKIYTTKYTKSSNHESNKTFNEIMNSLQNLTHSDSTTSTNKLISKLSNRQPIYTNTERSITIYTNTERKENQLNNLTHFRLHRFRKSLQLDTHITIAAPNEFENDSHSQCSASTRGSRGRQFSFTASKWEDDEEKTYTRFTDKLNKELVGITLGNNEHDNYISDHNTSDDEKHEDNYHENLSLLHHFSHKTMADIFYTNYNNSSILYDSIIKLHSTDSQYGIEYAALLSKDTLYFTSVHNYQLWRDVKCRTKMYEVIEHEHTIIDGSTALKLCQNLNLIEDKDIIQSNILPYFQNKTIQEIKSKILFHDNQSNSLTICSLFNLSDQSIYDSKLNVVNTIIINNINTLPVQHIDNFMSCVLKNITWAREEQQGYSKVITLSDYHPKSVIETMNNIASKYVESKNISQTVTISSYSKHLHSHRNMSLGCIYLKDINSVELLMPQSSYCFILRNSSGEIRCELESNNVLHEWFTHIDYLLHYSCDPTSNEKNDTATSTNHVKSKSSNSRLLNDFIVNDELQKQLEISTTFSFGIYLNYWEKGYLNIVTPIYPTLKHELLNNQHASMPEKQYYNLYTKCTQVCTNKIIAKNIGINNEKFNILGGTHITVNHLIALKLYTDYDTIQNVFKKQCRKIDAKETLEQIVKKNAQIAHWCRYIKESCTFFGQVMPKDMRVYTGLNNKLLFGSLKQNFECPLSTTLSEDVANIFSEGSDGIIVMLRASNPKTTYFNVSWLSQHTDEQERLFMGASLRICDIYEVVNSCHKSNYTYISALNMFEEIMNGYLIVGNESVQNELYCLITHVLYRSTALDRLVHVMNENVVPQAEIIALKTFLTYNEFDSDSLKNDLEDLNTSNIMHCINMPCSIEALKQYSNQCEETPSEYVLSLYINMVENMKRNIDNNLGWINKKQLTQLKHQKLKCLFVGCGAFFAYYNINLSNLRSVREYRWNIKDEEYQRFRALPPRHYLYSQEYEYVMNNKEVIKFHARICAKYSDECQKSAIFFHLNEMPQHIGYVEVVFDVSCKKKPKYRHTMQPQWLSKNNLFCGFQSFPFTDLNKNEEVLWVFGVKILQTLKRLPVVNRQSNHSNATFNSLQNHIHSNNITSTNKLTSKLSNLQPIDRQTTDSSTTITSITHITNPSITLSISPIYTYIEPEEIITLETIYTEIIEDYNEKKEIDNTIDKRLLQTLKPPTKLDNTTRRNTTPYTLNIKNKL
eukprot:46687_1